MSDLFDLSGRIALVTGASQGLGRRFARVLAEHGAAVGLAARQLDKLAELEREIAGEGGRSQASASTSPTTPASSARWRASRTFSGQSTC
jgi:NAD(P)-dependent dehydrogenase (short-subunit alcohol dehydrogenase family)